jgi:parallel beta-helix repeat protein
MLLLSTFATTINVRAASDTIYIMYNGDVSPSTAPIHRNGDLYTFTDNIHKPIVVYRNNIVIDGANYQLTGPSRDSSEYGITLTLQNYVTVKNLEITEWGVGIYQANHCNITDDIIRDCYEGLRLTNDNTVYRNVINSTNIGIYSITYNAKNVIIGNTITHNGYGIYLYGSTSNTIIENNIKFNYYGIAFQDSNQHAKDHRIFHNNFIDNSKSVDIWANRGNYWDDGYPSGGNYWNNFAGPDEKSGHNQDQPGSDGIIDTPYYLASDNIDHYPFVNPWGVPIAIINIDIDSSREELGYWKNEANITTRVKNLGTYVARDALITVGLPYNFETQDSTSWTGQINPGQEITMNLKIKATRCIHGRVYVNVEYKDFFGSIKQVSEYLTIPLNELVLIENAESWTDVNLSPHSVDEAKTWTGAENLASGIWLTALIKDLALDDITAGRMFNYTNRLLTWLRNLWNEKKVDPETLTFLADAIASLALNTFGLYVVSHQPQKILEDGTMNYHAGWVMKATYETLNLIKDMYLQMIEQVIRKPTDISSIQINDPQGKLYLQVLVDGKQCTTYYVDNIAFALVDANATIIKLTIDATDAEYLTEQYDIIYFSVRSDALVEQKTITETIAKNEQQEATIKMKPDGSIESITIPEFPNVLIAALLLVTILFAITLLKKRKKT